jgi:hypothetical protein
MFMTKINLEIVYTDKILIFYYIDLDGKAWDPSSPMTIQYSVSHL